MDLSKRLNIEKAQNFMRQYRDPESCELRKLSANQFMDVWSHYDSDGRLYYVSLEIDYFRHMNLITNICANKKFNIIRISYF